MNKRIYFSRKPLVSIVIVVLNNREGFKGTIESVLQNERQLDLELIVIDGGSSDGTLDLIEKYSQNLSYWETGKDLGIANAFNRGIREAKGYLITLLNSGDYWEKDTLKKIYNLYNSDSSFDIYCGSVRYVDTKSGYNYIRHPNISNMKKRMSIFHPSMFVSRICYEEIGGYDESMTLAMDSEWCHRALVNNKKFKTIDKVLANMTLGGVSDTRYFFSLKQYRDSVIKYKLLSPFMANVFFVYYLIFKTLLRIKFFIPIKKILDKLV